MIDSYLRPACVWFCTVIWK